MDNLLPILLALIGGGGLGVLFQELRLRRQQPRDDAKDTVTLQRDVTQAFREANTLHVEDAKTIREQALTITALTNANTALIVKIDGLPMRIAEQAAQLLVKEGFILAQTKALVQAGVLSKDQPEQPAEIPLTELVPPTLLNDLAEEKDLLRAGDKVKLVDKEGEHVTTPILKGDEVTILKEGTPSESDEP